MRGDGELVCISLEKRPNGRSMSEPKPMRIVRVDADRLVGSGRAIFISKTDFKKMSDSCAPPVKSSIKKRAKKKD